MKLLPNLVISTKDLHIAPPDHHQKMVLIQLFDSIEEAQMVKVGNELEPDFINAALSLFFDGGSMPSGLLSVVLPDCKFKTSKAHLH